MLFKAEPEHNMSFFRVGQNKTWAFLGRVGKKHEFFSQVETKYDCIEQNLSFSRSGQNCCSKCILVFKKKYICSFFFTSFTPLLSTASKLSYTFYLLILLRIVCIVLLWFVLTFLQESGNLDAIFKIRRRRKNILASWFWQIPATPPPFLVKS